MKTDEVFSLLNQILKLDPAEAETLVFRAEMFMVLDKMTRLYRI